MSEKLDLLMNNCRTRLTKLYPDETLSRAMFAVMEVMEELVAEGSTVAVPGISVGLGQWMEGADLRTKELDDRMKAVTDQAAAMAFYWKKMAEHLTARIVDLEANSSNSGARSLNGIKNDINDLREELVAGLRELAADIES